MRSSRWVLILACSSALACSPPNMSLREQRVIQQAVEGQLDSWVRAINNRESDSILAFYQHSYELTVVWADGQVSHGWDEEEAALKERFGSIERINFVKQNVQVEILSSDLALTIFRHSLDIVSTGGVRQRPASGSVTLLWARNLDDNLWRIHTQHVSVTPPSAN